MVIRGFLKPFLFTVFHIVLNESIYFRLRRAAGNKFICQESVYQFFPKLIADGKCAHTSDICIVAEAGSLGGIYVREKRSIGPFYFVGSDGNTEAGSADEDTSVILFGSNSFCYFDRCIGVYGIFASEISNFTLFLCFHKHEHLIAIFIVIFSFIIYFSAGTSGLLFAKFCRITRGL